MTKGRRVLHLLWPSAVRREEQITSIASTGWRISDGNPSRLKLISFPIPKSGFSFLTCHLLLLDAVTVERRECLDSQRISRRRSHTSSNPDATQFPWVGKDYTAESLRVIGTPYLFFLWDLSRCFRMVD
jgi:hypothetical protein